MKISKDKIIKKERQKDEKVKTILTNTDYIKWLVEFTKDKEIFCDDDWDYSSEKLDEIDQAMVNELQIFFEGIYKYARMNYIYSLVRPLGECYHIIIGDIGFEIGYISGQGTRFYCRRISLEKTKNAIDFMDIVNNKNRDNVEYIKRSLSELSNMLVEMYDNGVPIEAIDEAINRGTKYIYQKEQKRDTREQKKLKKEL